MRVEEIGRVVDCPRRERHLVFEPVAEGVEARELAWQNSQASRITKTRPGGFDLLQLG